MLSVEGLTVAYGGIRALDNLSLTVEAGELVALIGANGAGKSTLLRALSGLVRPVSGRILLDGIDITHAPCHRIVRLGMSHVPEGRRIFANLTVAENLALGAYVRRDRAGIRADRDRALALFPRLKERLTQVGGTLSGGEQQMLAIGRALMANPRLLLLDEPSLGLAPTLVRDIFHTLEALNRSGVPLLLVEQNAHMALRIARRGYVLESGRIFLSGDASALAGDARVREAYLGE
ncbi:MAG: ABC transporter ATP-binding protein [Armatimonadetes bacterium]|nr:ABC transporter ATP-binding protein [Armatimonadota bacterium]